jgi:uncharacterized membrane protein
MPKPSVGLAISWAFDTFRRNALAFLALAGVVVAISFAQQVVTTPLNAVIDQCLVAADVAAVNGCAEALSFTAFMSAVLGLMLFVLTFLATIGVYRAALRTTQGQQPSFADMLTGQYLGTYVLVTLAQLGLIIVGLIAFIIPGLLIGFLVQLAHYYVLDKGYGVGAALKSSITVIMRNVLPGLTIAAFALIVIVLGSFFFGLLTLVTLPFTALFMAHLYRQFNGEPIAP